LPEDLFDLKHYRELKVAKNNHVLLSQDKHYYSVPYAYTGAKVTVIYTRSMVRIYAKGKSIAVHKRTLNMGGYTTVKDHLCSAHQHYIDRSPEYYLQKAKVKSEPFYQLIQLMFQQKRHPEQLYRTCDGLLSLQRKTDPEIFQKACLLAIDNQNYSYMFLLNILKNKMTEQVEVKQEQPIGNHINIRGREYYTQIQINFNN